MSLEDAWSDAPLTEDTEEPSLKQMSFLQHLEELRRRIIVSSIALLVSFFLCWGFASEIFEILQQPVLKHLAEGDRLAYSRLTAPFFLYMKVSFFASLFLASPILLAQVWFFIAPGLYPREKKYAAPFILFATLFFLGGGWFGFRYILPIACRFFIEMGQQFKQVITVDDYLSFATKMVLGMAFVFETPILIFFLTRLGIVTPAFLLRNFKYAVLISFIIAAVITPTPDMVTQSALAVPMILLYLLGVGVSFVFQRRTTGEQSEGGAKGRV